MPPLHINSATRKATGRTVWLTAGRRPDRRRRTSFPRDLGRRNRRRSVRAAPESIVDVVGELRDLESTRASTYKWKIRGDRD